MHAHNSADVGFAADGSVQMFEMHFQEGSCSGSANVSRMIKPRGNYPHPATGGGAGRKPATPCDACKHARPAHDLLRRTRV